MRIQISDFLKVRIRSSGTTKPTCPLAIARMEGQGATPLGEVALRCLFIVLPLALSHILSIWPRGPEFLSLRAAPDSLPGHGMR